MALQFGRYVVEDEGRDRLGRGAFGQVYRARDPKLQRTVAIKVLLEEVRPDTHDAERFFREARALAALQHPGIVPVFDFGDEHGVFYLVLAYYSGGTLQGRLQERLKAGLGPFSPAETLTLLEPICGGLAAAHRQGMIHRDLKPANLLLDADGRPAISDFGLVHLLGEAGSTVLTRSGDVMGTPAYMGPEQWEPEVRPITAQTDLYALGCVVHCLLTGHAPFQGSAPVLQARHLSAPPPRLSTQLPGLPRAWDDAVGCLLAKDPEDRFATADAFLDWLKAALADATRQLPKRTLATAAPAPVPAAPEEASLGRAETLHPPLARTVEETLAAGTTLLQPAPSPTVSPRGPSGRLLATAGVALLVVALLVLLVWPRRSEPKAASPAAATASASPRVADGNVGALEMRFVPVPMPDGTAVEFAVCETRVKDFGLYAGERQSGTWNDPVPPPPTAAPNWREPGFAQNGDHPVVWVSWHDAAAFCRWLTARERAAGRLGNELEYRLPREAEWAAAAGPGEFAWRWEGSPPASQGSEWPPPENSGNFSVQPDWKWDDAYRWTAPVGSFKRNFLGLHDLAGNVHEWCADLFAAGSPERSLRGGSYLVGERAGLRSAHRRGRSPDYRDAATGFRVVRAKVGESTR